MFTPHMFFSIWNSTLKLTNVPNNFVWAHKAIEGAKFMFHEKRLKLRR